MLPLVVIVPPVGSAKQLITTVVTGALPTVPLPPLVTAQICEVG